MYGHFGQGCVHIRIPFDLVTADGISDFRGFLVRAAELVSSYGGSLSGEHGDGQARGELLETMFGPEIVHAFGEVKALFDPRNLMNPGKVVRPNRLDENLRLGADWDPTPHRTAFQYPDDDGSFTRATMRCVGIGNCNAVRCGVGSQSAPRRRFSSSRFGRTTFPGFIRLRGSNRALTSPKACTISGPNIVSSSSPRACPSPCSPDSDPP